MYANSTGYKTYLAFELRPTPCDQWNVALSLSHLEGHLEKLMTQRYEAILAFECSYNLYSYQLILHCCEDDDHCIDDEECPVQGADCNLQ